MSVTLQNGVRVRLRVKPGIPGKRGAPGASLTPKGSLDSISDLPMDAAVGDVWIIDGFAWAWDGLQWNNTGPWQGPAGDSWRPDASGPRSGRSAYDGMPVPFSYLATDEGMVYFRQGSGWSVGQAFPGAGLANEPEAVAGLTNDRLMTPLRGAEQIEAVTGTRQSMLALSPPTALTSVRTSGYTTRGDGGGALYRQVSGEPSHPGKLQTPDGRWWEIAEDVITPAMCGPNGSNQTLNIQRAMQIAAALSGQVRIKKGTYLCDPLIVPNGVRVLCQKSTVIKLRAVGPTSIRLVSFASDATSSSWDGGVIDGDRATHGSSWTNAGGVWDGWFGMVCETPGVRVSNLVLRNWVDRPAWFAGDEMDIDGVTSEDCGGAITFGYRWMGSGRFPVRPDGNGASRQNVRNIHATKTDNAGIANVFQHAIDIYAPKDGKYHNLRVTAQGGDLNGGSAWASGITVENAVNCALTDWEYISPTTEVLEHLAFTMLGCVSSPLVNPKVFNIAGQAVEQNACFECALINPQLDGNYRSSSAVSALTATSLGVTVYNGAWRPERGTKSISNTRGMKISGGYIRRFGTGGIIRGCDCDIDDTEITGNNIDGLVILKQVSTSYYAGATNRWLRVNITNARIEYNGRAGIEATSFSDLRVTNSRIRNNGQNAALSADVRAGVRAQTGDRLLWLTDNDLGDNQAWMVAGMASFQPQEAGADGRLYVTFLPADRVNLGQRITLVGAGPSSADIAAKIIDIDAYDQVTLQASSGATLVDNSVALSGTWSGAGTTLTGSGGAASTQIVGPAWIRNSAGEWRQVFSASGANSMRISEPFTGGLSGATLYRNSCSVAGIPSQAIGARIFGTVVSTLMRDNGYEGVPIKTNISTPQNLLSGSEYWRSENSSPTLATSQIGGTVVPSHVLSAVALNVDTALSGTLTSWSLQHRQGSTVLKTLASGLSLAANTKVNMLVAHMDMNLDAGNTGLYCIANSGAPSAGVITGETLWRVSGVAPRPNV